jgi:3'-phosphoadenosine 5'-phosphosulfate sulfotransferase (PAPS reductase)/FAD synthetase
MIIKKYQLFLEAFLSKDKENAVEQIISYITRNTNVDLYPYNELFYIQKENLFQVDEKILVAVSGGIDSIVLSKLFSNSKTNQSRFN